MTLAPDDPRHGAVHGYSNHACRCQPCREEHNRNQRATRWKARGGEPVLVVDLDAWRQFFDEAIPS